MMRIEYRHVVRFVMVNRDLLLDDCAMFGIDEPRCIECGEQVEWRDAKYQEFVCSVHRDMREAQR